MYILILIKIYYNLINIFISIVNIVIIIFYQKKKCNYSSLELIIYIFI